MSETITGDNINRYKDINICLGFMRQAKEELINNKPVSAFLHLEKAEDYAFKVRDGLYDIKEGDVK